MNDEQLRARLAELAPELERDKLVYGTAMVAVDTDDDGKLLGLERVDPLEETITDVVADRFGDDLHKELDPMEKGSGQPLRRGSILMHLISLFGRIGGVEGYAPTGKNRGATSRGKGEPTQGVKQRAMQRRGKRRRRPGKSHRRRPVHKR